MVDNVVVVVGSVVVIVSTSVLPATVTINLGLSVVSVNAVASSVTWLCLMVERTVVVTVGLTVLV